MQRRVGGLRSARRGKRRKKEEEEMEEECSTSPIIATSPLYTLRVQCYNTREYIIYIGEGTN